MTTVSTTSGSTIDPNSAVQQAAQSIISGSTNLTMDVNSLVSAIVNAKVTGRTDALNNKKTSDNTQLTAIGTLKSMLSLMQSSLTNLANDTTLSSFTATATATADGKGLTATAGSGAVAGSYSVSVSNIATAQSITSGAFKATDTLGTGSMAINVNGKTSTIKIDSSNNTLSGIASAINTDSASDNPGVTATIINGSDGAHLVLRSTSTGQASAINITATPDSSSTDTGLSKLNVKSINTTTSTDSNNVTTTTPTSTSLDTASQANWTQNTVGQDAKLTIAGTSVTSASNAISGVTLNLTQDSVASSPQTLTIGQDVTGQKTAIGAFGTAYNNFISTAATLTSYDSTASSQGALLDDSMMNTIKNTISKAVGTGSNAVNLASIGISLQPDGSLKTDDTVLTNALTNNTTKVAQLFNSTNGVATQLNTSLTSFLGTGGVIDTRTTALNKDLTNIADQQTQLTTYTVQLTSDYNAQFTALNTLTSKMSTQGSYLTALFGGTNSAGALATNKT